MQQLASGFSGFAIAVGATHSVSYNHTSGNTRSGIRTDTGSGTTTIGVPSPPAFTQASIRSTM